MSSVSHITSRSAKIGLAALVGVVLTGATSVPFTSTLYKLYPISAEEILIHRSVFCILVALVLSRGRALSAAPLVISSGALVAVSSILFYRTLAEWRIAPTVTILSLIPLVNLGIEWIQGMRPKSSVMLSVLIVIAGTAWALEPWNVPLSTLGWVLAVSMVLTSAVGSDMWSKIPRGTSASHIVLWLSVWVLAFSVIIATMSGTSPSTPRILADPHARMYLAGYVITVVPYLFFCVVPFIDAGKMNVVHTNLIMAVGTPLTIICGKLIAHEDVRTNQWIGVCIAVVAGIHVSIESVRAHQSSTLTHSG